MTREEAVVAVLEILMQVGLELRRGTGEEGFDSYPAGWTEQIAADPSLFTPETGGEHPYTKPWEYRGRELEKSFQKIVGKTVETKIYKFITYNSIFSYSLLQFPGSLEMQKES